MTKPIKGQEIQLPPLPCELHKSKFWDEGIEWNVAGERALRKERQVQLLAALREVESLKASLHSLRWIKIEPGCEMPLYEDHLLRFQGADEYFFCVGYWNRLTRSWIVNGESHEGLVVTHYCRILPPTAEQDNPKGN